MSNLSRLIAVALCAALCCPFSSASAFADSTFILSIDEMFRLAETYSVNINSARIASSVAQSAVADAMAARLPEIQAQLSVSYLGNGAIADRDFSNFAKADIPHFGNNFVLKASQPIFSGGAISSQINLAKMEKQLADINLDASRSATRFSLIGFYLKLAMLSNQASVYDANIDLTKSVISQMRFRQQQGTVLKNDITRYELQLENLILQRKRVTDNMKIINHHLVTIINLPPSTVISPDTALLASLPEKLSERHWQDLAALNSPKLRLAALNADIQRENVNLERAARLPKIALFAEEHLDGPITIEVPPINKNFNYWFVGIGISYDISSLFKANKRIAVAKNKSRLADNDHLLAIQNVENCVQAAFTEFLTSFSDLSTQTKSVELANQNYGVVNNRYNNGVALVTEMTDAANTKLSAELGLVNSRINVIYNYYNMLFISNSL